MLSSAVQYALGEEDSGKISQQKFDLPEKSEASPNPVIECAEDSSDTDSVCSDGSSGDEWLVVCLRML